MRHRKFFGRDCGLTLWQHTYSRNLRCQIGRLGPLEGGVEDLHHMPVAAAAGLAAKDDANQSDALPFNRRNKIETRGVDITCLDAVCSLIGRQQLVVVLNF